MDVIFNFPDLAAFKVKLDVVPRIGEVVQAPNIPYECFITQGSWDNYHDARYNKGEWVVTRVNWCIHPDNQSYVNIHLCRALAPVTQNN